jgi:hypothetical protein
MVRPVLKAFGLITSGFYPAMEREPVLIKKKYPRGPERIDPGPPGIPLIARFAP